MLVNELDNCKEKGNKYAEEYIKEIQDVYRQEDIVMKTSQTIDKGKQRVEKEGVFLYKPYDVDKLRPKTPKPHFIQNEINNLDKYMKYMQSPIKTVPFYPLPYYKSIQPQTEQNEQY